MRSLALALAVTAGLALGAPAARACQSDSDCEPGTHCQVAQGRMDGVCVNDVAPAPIDEQQTVETPPVDDDGGNGNPCQTHDDCGVGGRCVKQPGATSGVCAGGM